MLGLVKEISGQKTIVPLTTDTGTGAPVGSLISQYKKVPMSGYLYCDGSTFDETAYPALYLYLGTNVLPDYRECVMVGAEQNTTDSIATHDVYTQGQFKDDQLQSHNHGTVKVNGVADFGVIGDPSWSESSVYSVSIAGGSNNTISLSAGSNTGRSGTTTHGKQKAVYVYIKATSGLAENQQENVLNTINENNSYSTEEHATGKKWIDGKPIYSKVIIESSAKNEQKNVDVSALSIDTCVKLEGTCQGANYMIPINTYRNDVVVMSLIANNSSFIILFASGDLIASTVPWKVVLEYTKTTDN